MCVARSYYLMAAFSKQFATNAILFLQLAMLYILYSLAKG